MFVDIESGLVLAGALGSALATGAGATSQRAWAYPTFAPAVGSQIHANEPTRDLFHGGGQALALMSRRYEMLSEQSEALKRSPFDGCLVREDLVSALLKIPTATRASRDVLEREVEQLLSVCDALVLATSQGKQFSSALQFAVEVQPARYAAELVDFDQGILKRDRELRYNPVETIGAIIASPLRTLDSLLTGENAQAALKTIKTVQAFSGLDQSLSSVRLPPLPDAVPIPKAFSPEARAQGRNMADVSNESLEEARIKLRIQVEQQMYAVRIMTEAAQAAAATELRFQVDVATGGVTIELTAPDVPPGFHPAATRVLGLVTPRSVG